MSIAYWNPRNQIYPNTIEEGFSAKNITKFGGAGLLRRHFEKLGLLEHFE